jgi:hypothetical protein
MGILDRFRGEPREEPPGLSPSPGEKMVIFSGLRMR